MPKVTKEPHKDGDFFVDYEEKVFEDVKADAGEKALVTFHTVAFEGSIGLVNLLQATRLQRKDPFGEHERAHDGEREHLQAVDDAAERAGRDGADGGDQRKAPTEQEERGADEVHDREEEHPPVQGGDHRLLFGREGDPRD